jgi:hypothetical protein
MKRNKESKQGVWEGERVGEGDRVEK